ncbi:MAG: hypothetical protein EPO62_00410 [Candidatus Nitrosotenuis sp.]|nr:MAG: hypothetical protein EPO62_00410 [Candidatus Nitrosotenuis sp.]
MHNDNTKNFDELTLIVKARMDSKNDLINWLKRNLELRIPKNTSYDKIFSILKEKDKEHDFSMKFSHCNTFDEIIDKNEINDALHIFSKDELILFANQLSHNQKKWKYDKSTYLSIIKSILKNTKKQDFRNLFPKLILEKKISPVIQYYKSVIGPLGITRAKEDRKSITADELVSLLSDYITDDTFDLFLKNVIDVNVDLLKNLNEKLMLFAVQQILLTNYTMSEISTIFNKLVGDKIIKINEVKRYWGYTITPCGLIVDTESDPIQNLVNVLMNKIPNNELDEELIKGGFASGPLSDRVYGLCVNEKPEQILDREFGKSDLKQLARSLGLANVDEISDKNALSQYVMLKLGFTLPQTPWGILNYCIDLERYKTELNNSTGDEIGIITKVYVIIEKMLKDLIYFYSFIVVTDLFMKNYVEIIDEKINERIREKLSLDADVSRLTLGKLLNLLKKLNSIAEHDDAIKKFFETKLYRKTLFPHDELTELGTIIDNRARFTHDYDSSKNPSKLLSPLQIIESSVRIMKKLYDEKIYPVSFNVLRAISNQYNVNYYEVILEDGNQITVVTDHLDIDKSWLMINFTDKIAIKPIIVERFW